MARDWAAEQAHPVGRGSRDTHLQMLMIRRFDFTTTFDVVVGNPQGQQKRFPVYHDILTARSNFLLAARAAEPRQSVHLEGEDPEVFSLYLNCVHSGTEVLRAAGQLLNRKRQVSTEGAGKLVKKERDGEQSEDEGDEALDKGRLEALIRLYMLADRLQDSEMMNLTIDELVRVVEEDDLVPSFRSRRLHSRAQSATSSSRRVNSTRNSGATSNLNTSGSRIPRIQLERCTV